MTDFLVHLVCGSTGAGKTTYAEALSKRIGGVRFSIDEWMTALFWMDSPQPIEASWSMERVERCLSLIWSTAARIAERGVPCVLDVGLSQSLSAQLHFVDVPAQERWRRVEGRNRAEGGSKHLPFDVTREMFDLVESLWEPPTDAEMDASSGVRISGGTDAH